MTTNIRNTIITINTSIEFEKVDLILKTFHLTDSRRKKYKVFKSEGQKIGIDKYTDIISLILTPIDECHFDMDNLKYYTAEEFIAIY